MAFYKKTLTIEIDAECDVPEYALRDFIEDELVPSIKNTVGNIYLPESLHHNLSSDPYQEHRLTVRIK